MSFVGHLSGSEKIMSETIRDMLEEKENSLYFVQNLNVNW